MMQANSQKCFFPEDEAKREKNQKKIWFGLDRSEACPVRFVGGPRSGAYLMVPNPPPTTYWVAEYTGNLVYSALTNDHQRAETRTHEYRLERIASWSTSQPYQQDEYEYVYEYQGIR